MAKWKHTLYCGGALREAIEQYDSEDSDSAKILEVLVDCCKELKSIVEGENGEDYFSLMYEDYIVEVDGALSEAKELKEQGDEIDSDYVNTLLEILYDSCDEERIWVAFP